MSFRFDVGFLFWRAMKTFDSLTVMQESGFQSAQDGAVQLQVIIELDMLWQLMVWDLLQVIC